MDHIVTATYCREALCGVVLGDLQPRSCQAIETMYIAESLIDNFPFICNATENYSEDRYVYQNVRMALVMTMCFYIRAPPII